MHMYCIYLNDNYVGANGTRNMFDLNLEGDTTSLTIFISTKRDVESKNDTLNN